MPRLTGFVRVAGTRFSFPGQVLPFAGFHDGQLRPFCGVAGRGDPPRHGPVGLLGAHAGQTQAQCGRPVFVGDGAQQRSDAPLLVDRFESVEDRLHDGGGRPVACWAARVVQGIDKTTPGGRLVFHVLAAVAEFEHDLIVERTNKDWRQLATVAGPAVGSRDESNTEYPGPRHDRGRGSYPVTLIARLRSRFEELLTRPSRRRPGSFADGRSRHSATPIPPQPAPQRTLDL